MLLDTILYKCKNCITDISKYMYVKRRTLIDKRDSQCTDLRNFIHSNIRSKYKDWIGSMRGNIIKLNKRIKKIDNIVKLFGDIGKLLPNITAVSVLMSIHNTLVKTFNNMKKQSYIIPVVNMMETFQYVDELKLLSYDNDDVEDIEIQPDKNGELTDDEEIMEIEVY